MTAQVAVLGAGSHGSDVARLCMSRGVTPKLLDDDPAKGCDPCSTVTDHPYYLLGFNRPDTRREWDQRIGTGSTAAVVYHASVVGEPPWVEPGVVVAAGVTLGPAVSLGRHVHVNQGCTLVRCTIGDYTTVAPGVDIAGDVTIGSGCFIGIGARIVNLVSIGDGAVIGAGAVVLEDVPAGETWVGVPARSSC